MEHLYRGPKELDIPFPYLSEINFDFAGEWLQYPDHEGVSLAKIRYFEWRQFPSGKLSKVLQNWLFFGLLRAILPSEIPIRVEDFIRIGEDGERFISTGHLGEYLAKWAELVGRLPVEEKQLIAQRNKSILEEARLFTYTLSHLPSRSLLSLHLFLPVSLEIAFSCALLGEALELTNATLLDISPVGVWSLGDLLLEKLEMDGWCPFIVSRANTFGRLCTLHYCATLGSPKVKLNHGKCSEKLCHHTLKDEARHFMHDGPCAMMKPKVKEIISLIRENKTPILRYRTGSHEETLETEAASSSTAYVAISHVWSDGLGNPKGNEMNKCQLSRVQTAVDRLYQPKLDASRDSSWWWLDTLCVPTGDAYKKEKGLTISRMKEIYTKAEKVLVIDSGLSACDEATETLEILARFRLSNWIRRLWTFQEGLFAKNIYLLVGATPVSLSSLISKAKKLPQEGFQNEIAQDLMGNFGSIFGSSIAPQIGATDAAKVDTIPTEGRLLGVLSTVATRTSTFLRDEPLCLALLLDINPTPIIHEIEREERERRKKEKKREKIKSDKQKQNHQKEARERSSSRHKNNTTLPVLLGPSKAGMIKFIELANEASQSLKPPGCIPPYVIAARGKRLTKPGYRWAPESFLRSQVVLSSGSFNVSNPEDPTSRTTRASGTLRKQGLRVQFPGIIISEINGDRPLHSNFLIDTSTDPRRREYMPKFWRISYAESEHDPPWESSRGDVVGIAPTTGDSDKLAVIVCDYGDLNLTTCTCVLVRVVDEQQQQQQQYAGPDGDLVVSRLCTLVGKKTPVYDDQEWIREPWKRVRGRWLPWNQMWLVD